MLIDYISKYTPFSFQDWVPHGGLEFLQFATQTHVLNEKVSEDIDTSDQVGKLAEEVAPLVEQILLDLVQHTQYGFEVENDRLAYRLQLACYVVANCKFHDKGKGVESTGKVGWLMLGRRNGKRW